jgi:putative ABC transport system permease protein
MNIWKLSFQNMRSKPLYTFLSVLVLSLSIALLIGINHLKSSFEYQIENNLGNIDMVLGAKGSPLQLILASVLHIDNPTGNISYKEAREVLKNPLIKSAVPISYGDNYKGYKIVGTTPAFLNFYEAETNDGRLFDKTFEVVIGNSIAERLQLKIGDTFKSSHGLMENDIDVHDDEFVVVGVLKPTQKVIDRLIISNLQSIWAVHDHDHDDEGHSHEEEHEHDQSHEHSHEEKDHDHEAHEHDHEHNHDHTDHDNDEDDKEITSMLVSFRNPIGALTMPRKINDETNIQAALPKYELNRLYEFTGVGIKTIAWIAYMILFISGLTIFISLYKMIKERAFELALLRTYGASNFQLVRMVFYEGLVVVVFALITGFLFAKLGLYVITDFMQSGSQYDLLQGLALEEYLKIIGLVFAMIILSTLLSIYPILKMNISKILRNET